MGLAPVHRVRDQVLDHHLVGPGPLDHLLLADRGTVEELAARSGHDLPPASWSLLEHLDARGALKVSQIAACHGVDISSVTPRLKTLENAGLVERTRSPTDARVALISIAPAGRLALQGVHAARRELLAPVLEDIDTGLVTTATQVLDRIASGISTVDDRLDASVREPVRPF